MDGTSAKFGIKVGFKSPVASANAGIVPKIDSVIYLCPDFKTVETRVWLSIFWFSVFESQEMLSTV